MKFIFTFFLIITVPICMFAENIVEVSPNSKFKDLDSALRFIREQRNSSFQKSYVIKVREGIYH